MDAGSRGRLHFPYVSHNSDTRSGRILEVPMRTLIVVVVIGALVVPATALSMRRAPGDGTLAVRGGDGIVRIDLRGAVIGAIKQGTLVVVDPEENSCDRPLVFDADNVVRRVEPGELGQKRFACFYTGANIRFRFVGGQHEIRLNGRGIAVSAVGRGTAYLKGAVRVADDGQFSVNGDPWASLPDAGETVRVASRTANTSG